MAIAVTHIQGEASSANTQSVAHVTTFLPVAGRTYLVVLRTTAGTSLSGDIPTVTHGGTGLTLALVAGSVVLSQDNTVASGHKVCAFVGTATGSPTTGVFTTDSGEASNNTSQQYELIEITGCDTTTPVPQDDIGSANNNVSAGLTITLAGAFVNSGSFTLSALGLCVVTTDPTIPTGWASLQSRTNSNPAGRLVVAYENGNDSTADWTGLDTGGTQDIAGFILEIAEAPAAGSDVLIQGLSAIDRGVLSQTAVRLGGLLEG